MTDLKSIEPESASGENPNRKPSLFRKAARLILRPGRRLFHYYQRDLVGRLEHFQTQLNRTDWHAEALHQNAEGLSSHLESLSFHLERLSSGLENLSQHHGALQSRFDALGVQYEDLLRLLPGINNRFETLDDKLSAVQALHWDHVALARRLGAIEDVLAASGDPARDTIEEGRGRPLLPFPGLESHELKKFRVS